MTMGLPFCALGWMSVQGPAAPTCTFYRASAAAHPIGRGRA